MIIIQLERFQMPGAPPEGHERQCHSKSKVTRKRCRRWALVTSNYCQFHGGRRASQAYSKKRGYNLPSFYSKYLGPKLKTRIEELMARPHTEQITLFEELAISRSAACEALKLSQPLFDGRAETLSPELKSLMVQTLGQAMDNVKVMVLAASKLEKDAGDTISIRVLNLVVMQIVSAVNEVCGTEHLDIAQAIADAIDSNVRLPLNNALASVITVEIDDNVQTENPKELEADL